MSTDYICIKKSYINQPLKPAEFISSATPSEIDDVWGCVGGCQLGDLCIVTRNYNNDLQIVVIQLDYFNKDAIAPCKGITTCGDFWVEINDWKNNTGTYHLPTV